MSFHLGLLVLIAAAPLLLLAVGLLLWTAALSRYAAESGLRETARALGTAVEREIASRTASLHELAALLSFDCRPSEAFRLRAKQVGARYGGSIELVAPDARGGFHPTRPGASDALADPVTGERTVFISVPVTGAGVAPCWLSIAVPAQRFAALLDPGDNRPAWIRVLTDGADAIIASSPADKANAASETGNVQLAFRHINDGRWTVAVAAPRAQVQAAWIRPLAAGIVAALLLTLLSLAAAAVYARQMKREIDQLGRLAEQVGEDARSLAPGPARVAELAALAQTLVRAHEGIRHRRVEHELRMQAESRRAAAEHADRSKDIFLATLSHELRGALTAVIGWLDVGRSHMDNRATLHKALDIALRNAKQQARIIDDLLDVSRIISGKFAVERHPIELGRLAKEALEACRPAAEEKRIELRCRVAEPVFIEGDRGRMLQATGNLLGNAIKFGRPGGWVELTLEQAGALARLAVADDGVGIEEHALPHIFERFWQAHSQGPLRRRGLGLGLPLVHYIVELHAGRVFAESAGPERGARFTIELPALLGVAPPAAQPRPAPSELEPSLNGLGVVAVDEDDDTLGWLQHLLASHGAMTWPAHTAEEAMALIERQDADVMISDFAVIEKGEALIKALHARPSSKRIAAVAFSSQPTEEACNRALSAGYDGFVAKPCDPVVLLRAVRAAVARSVA